MALKIPPGKSLPPKVTTSAGSSSAQPVTIEMIQQVLFATEKKLLQKMQTNIEELSGVIDAKIQTVLAELAARNQEIREEILFALKGLVAQVEDLDSNVQQVKADTEILKNKVEGVSQRVDRTDYDVILLQYREMEYAVRIRGLKEDRQENLREKIGEALASLLGFSQQEMERHMDKIFRVNSWVARQRKLPRDIVIYFTTINVRNKVLQATYKIKLEVQGQEVMILKEIPPKMLRARREYFFLVEELKNRQLQYRWDVPVGLVVNVSGERYRLNSIIKAKDFYENILKAGRSKSSVYKSKTTVESKPQEELLSSVHGGNSLSQEDFSQITVETIEELFKEQRMSRAATAGCKEELKMQQPKWITSYVNKSEVVGGARLTTRFQLENQQMLQRLQRFKDV